MVHRTFYKYYMKYLKYNAFHEQLGTGHYLWWGWHRREKGWVNKILSE
jgi:hypothetical protein